MADPGPNTLPDGEYFYICDYRKDHDFVGDGHQKSTDPDEDEAIKRRRFEACLAHDKAAGVTGSYLESYEFRRDVAFTPDLVHRATTLDCSMPQTLMHYDRVFQGTGGTYDVVSKEWKDAIESFEPHVHEFFPYELHFSDGVVRDYFIMRGTQVVSCFASKEDSKKLFDNCARYQDGTYVDEQLPVHAKRELLANRHWINTGLSQIALRALAEKLFPLIPRFTELVPLILV